MTNCEVGCLSVMKRSERKASADLHSDLDLIQHLTHKHKPIPVRRKIYGVL